jgi:phytoene synthase
MTTLAADHAACAAILRRSGSSFAMPIALLPEAKRRGTTALYAFCRVADDLVDDGGKMPVKPGLEGVGQGDGRV